MIEQHFLTKTDAAAEILRGEIMRGELAPGTPLQQSAVARRLGLSSTPVREAFVVLESEGLLEKRAHHGVVVAQRDPGDLIDVYEMRMALELEAFRRATRNLDDSLLAALQRQISEAERALPDTQAARRASARFHEMLIQASRSPVYIEVLRSLIQRSLFAVPLTRSMLDDFFGHHRRILRALKDGSYEDASRYLSEHLAKMTESLRAAVGNDQGGTVVELRGALRSQQRSRQGVQRRGAKRGP